MLTFQNYEELGNNPSLDKKIEFYFKVIEEYKTSETYQRAMVAQAYYARDNTAIVNRMTFLQKFGINNGTNIKFFKIKNGFFSKSVQQLSQYLLGNGVTLDESIKKKLGDTFDKDLNKMGLQALVDGVNWGFWNLDRLMVYRATEFCPIYDWITGDMRLGIRFLQNESTIYIEVYTEQGIYKYKKVGANGKVEILTDNPLPYKQTVKEDILGVEVVDVENYPTIPVFPLYANDLQRSELNGGLQEDIDAYDFINSDLTDGVTQIDGVYWVIKNYGGEDLRGVVEDIQQLKATYSDEAGAGADARALEVPFQAKKVALDLLEKRMYKETQTLNTEDLSTSDLRLASIEGIYKDLDLKTNLFEMQCGFFVQRILEINGITGVSPKFKRDKIVNVSEIITAIYTMRADLDHQTALELNPMIPDDMVDTILTRFALEDFSTGDDGEDEEIEEDNSKEIEK